MMLVAIKIEMMMMIMMMSAKDIMMVVRFFLPIK